jgi:hypothetical protein
MQLIHAVKFSGILIFRLGSSGPCNLVAGYQCSGQHVAFISGLRLRPEDGGRCWYSLTSFHVSQYTYYNLKSHHCENLKSCLWDNELFSLGYFQTSLCSQQEEDLSETQNLSFFTQSQTQNEDKMQVSSHERIEVGGGASEGHFD